jgi:hypothetical protein
MNKFLDLLWIISWLYHNYISWFIGQRNVLIRKFKDDMSSVLEVIFRCYSCVRFNVSQYHLLIDGTIWLRQQMNCILIFRIFLLRINQLYMIEGRKQQVSLGFRKLSWNNFPFDFNL